jgi:hypothetical protein
MDFSQTRTGLDVRETEPTHAGRRAMGVTYLSTAVAAKQQEDQTCFAIRAPKMSQPRRHAFVPEYLSKVYAIGHASQRKRPGDEFRAA